jgi:hypothetical protein
VGIGGEKNLSNTYCFLEVVLTASQSCYRKCTAGRSEGLRPWNCLSTAEIFGRSVNKRSLLGPATPASSNKEST